MSISDEVYYSVLSRLDNGELASALAKEYDISQNTITRWKREYETHKLNGTLDKAYNMDKLILAKIGEVIEAPDDLTKEGVRSFSKKVAGLEALDVDLQQTATVMNQRIRSLLMSVETPGELETYAKCLCMLRDAFFNKNVTQVNVQNNYGGQQGYSDFLGDKPRD